MVKSLFHLLFLLMITSQVVSAEPAVMALMRKKYSADSFIEVQFELNTWWSIREREEIKKGKLYIAPKDKFRVELGSETVVSDGLQYWHYNSKAAQVIIDYVKNFDPTYQPSKLLSSFLTGYNYKETFHTENETTLQWYADSLASETVYTKIEIQVNTRSGEVKTLKITDRNGNIQTYTFKKTVFGAKIPKEVFTFEVPDDIQVLDNRQ